jgi:hypothetical protein
MDLARLEAHFGWDFTGAFERDIQSQCSGGMEEEEGEDDLLMRICASLQIQLLLPLYRRKRSSEAPIAKRSIPQKEG